MDVTIERATPDDAETLVRLQIAAFHDDARLYPGVELGGPPGYDSVEVMRRKIAEDVAYKIVVDGQIVGGMVAFNYSDEHIHLDVLFIDPACHGRGIGTQAMNFLHQNHPAALWTLDTPVYALRNQHFYEKLGYVKAGQHQEPDDIALYAYERRT
jgi:GNAT superfamily N-acetyltransferase